MIRPVWVKKLRAPRRWPPIAPNHPLYAVTPNRDELAALTNLPTRSDRQLRIAADRLHGRGVEHVWIRLGGAGSLLNSAAGAATLLPAEPATVLDVTGAGDSMLAAFCYAVLDGQDPVEAARFGHAAAALTSPAPTPFVPTSRRGSSRPRSTPAS